MPWPKGIPHPHTQERNDKISKSRMGRFKGEMNPNWRGGKCLERGYILVRLPDHPSSQRGYVYEHRLIVEYLIGRYLTTSETIHHLDTNRGNNLATNLIGFIDNKSHKRFEKTGNLDYEIEQGNVFFDGRKYKKYEKQPAVV